MKAHVWILLVWTVIFGINCNAQEINYNAVIRDRPLLFIYEGEREMRAKFLYSNRELEVPFSFESDAMDFMNDTFSSEYPEEYGASTTADLRYQFVGLCGEKGCLQTGVVSARFIKNFKEKLLEDYPPQQPKERERQSEQPPEYELTIDATDYPGVNHYTAYIGSSKYEIPQKGKVVKEVSSILKDLEVRVVINKIYFTKNYIRYCVSDFDCGESTNSHYASKKLSRLLALVQNSSQEEEKPPEKIEVKLKNLQPKKKETVDTGLTAEMINETLSIKIVFSGSSATATISGTSYSLPKATQLKKTAEKIKPRKMYQNEITVSILDLSGPEVLFTGPAGQTFKGTDRSKDWYLAKAKEALFADLGLKKSIMQMLKDAF